MRKLEYTVQGGIILSNDINILRDLVKELNEITSKPIQEIRRNLWRSHNSLNRVQPLIYIRAFAYNEIFDKSSLKCEDPFYRAYEYYIHMMKFRDTIGDDYIIEPWLTVKSVYDTPNDLRWGVKVELGEKTHPGGAAAFKPGITGNEEEDIYKILVPTHKINEKATSERYEKLKNAVGDLIEIDLERGPVFGMWNQDISTDIGKLRGLEQLMWDVYDRPEWLHKLLNRMMKGILKVHEEAEKEGDYSLSNHQNQAMPYAEELRDPQPNIYGIKRNELWCFMASQETTAFGPDMFQEFMLQYQIPIMSKFGLIAYGCCEDLTQKIDYLKKIPNLRRIAVSPFANAKKCSEQIGEDYILSWRPNPSTMISTGLDEDYVRKHMKENFEVFKENNNYFDITLKDVETINNEPENVRKWVQIVREEIQ